MNANKHFSTLLYEFESALGRNSLVDIRIARLKLLQHNLDLVNALDRAKTRMHALVPATCDILPHYLREMEATILKATEGT